MFLFLLQFVSENRVRVQRILVICVLVVVFQRSMLISSSVEKNYQPLRWFKTSSFFFGYEKARFHTWDDRRRKKT